MTNSIRFFFVTIIISVTAFYPAMASHITADDFTYKYIKDTLIGGTVTDEYEVSLSIYEDCLNGSPEAIAQDNPAYLGLFDAVTGRIIELDTNVNYTESVPMPIIAAGSCDSGTTFLQLCVLRKTFTKIYYLPPSATGYVIAYQRCCLNAGIVNIQNPGEDGITAFCSIPPSGIAATNNSAIFINYPPFVIPVNYPLTFDCSAIDADHDSLSYSFSTALNGAGDPDNSKPYPSPPPYDTDTYIYPLSFSNPIYCSIPMKINSVTGLLTGTPNTIGRYLMDVSCSEWRGGVLINTTYREFQFVVDNCPSTAKTDSMEIYPNPATTSITIVFTDSIKQIKVTNVAGKIFDLPWSYVSPLGIGINDQDVLLDVSALDPGEYFIKINSDVVKKFVKLW